MDPLCPEPVVITGIGVLACNGIGREAFWNALQNAESGIGKIDRFDTSGFPCKIAGQLWDFDASDFVNKGTVRRWHRAVHLSIAATRLALEDADFDPAPYDPTRIAVGIGTSVGSPDETYESHREVYENQGWEQIDKLASTANSGHASTANVSSLFGFRGPSITIASGCATGLDMLAWGKEQVRLGKADAAVIGATETPLTEWAFAGTCALGILSERNDPPEKAMRPFDAHSDGLVLSEGSVVLVLERADKAVERGAHIFAEVAGTGATAEGKNPLVLQRDGEALARAILASLDEAHMDPAEVDCAHCHGVGLENYDMCEVNAYKTALGAHAHRIPFSAIKSMIGQAYSAGGLLSVAGAIMSLETGIIPPILNLENPVPGFDLDFVRNESRWNDPQTALVTALSFGGTHSAVVLRKQKRHAAPEEPFQFYPGAFAQNSHVSG